MAKRRKKSKPISRRTWLALAAAGSLAVAWDEGYLPVEDWIQPAGPEAPAEPPPSAEMQSLVRPVKTLLDTAQAPADDRNQLEVFYRAAADVIEREPARVKTTGQFREANKAAQELMFRRTGMAGKYAGLDRAVSEAIERAVGLENVSLDEAKRRKLVEVLRALAWAAK